MLTHSLHGAQEALLARNKCRRSFYFQEDDDGRSSAATGLTQHASARTLEEVPADGGQLSFSAQTAASAASLAGRHRARSVDEEAVIANRLFTGRFRARSVEDVAGTKRSKFSKYLKSMNRGVAYMGVDWFSIDNRRHRISWLFFVQNLYFWCYTGYIVSVVLLGATLIFLAEPDDGLNFWQAIYTAASCVSQSGLAVADWSKQSRSTYIISFCLILLGSASLLHCVPVILRVCSFREQTRLTRLMSRTESFTTDSIGTPRSGAAPHAIPFRRTHSDPCVGAVADDVEDDDTPPVKGPLQHGKTTVLRPPASGPFESPNGEGQPPAAGDHRTAFSHNFQNGLDQKPFKGSSVNLERRLQQATAGSRPQDVGTAVSGRSELSKARNLRHCSDALPERYRLEYKALRVVLKVVLGYWLACHLLGFTIFFVYFACFDGDIQKKFYKEGLNPVWHALYLSVSAFQNNGLVMTPSSVMDFASSPILLNTIALLIFFGNTGLPIMVRLIAVAWERRARHAGPFSERQQALDFLLEHPRRCFTHMFPAVHTLWLLLVVLGLNIITTCVILWQDSSAPSQAMTDMSWMNKFWNALFQSVSSRTAGLNSVNIAFLSQGTTFFLCVMMYFSTTPTVVTMRLSAVVGRGGPTDLDITGRAEGVEEDVLSADNSLKSQARRYLTQDVTYLVVAVFLICCLEQEQFAKSAKNINPDSDGIYGDFTFFKVLFEISSAYGTCGLSLGFRDQTASFSAVWSWPSQMILVLVMILGRLRGLPDSIDSSVRVALRHDAQNPDVEEEHRFIHV